jgi:hypothetical protein
MATRSPYNDRYKVDQKGKTRRSASSAKPKRGIADMTPASSSKKVAAKKKWWSAPPAANRAPVIEPTPEMKKLRKIWWGLWGASLAIAFIIIPLNQPTNPLSRYVSIAWGLWAAAMAGAFYLEFGPLRKARLKAMETVRSGSKAGKAEAAKAAKVETPKPAKAVTAKPAQKDDAPAPSADDTPDRNDV